VRVLRCKYSANVQEPLHEHLSESRLTVRSRRCGDEGHDPRRRGPDGDANGRSVSVECRSGTFTRRCRIVVSS
jgi:hypothetical protein